MKKMTNDDAVAALRWLFYLENKNYVGKSPTIAEWFILDPMLQKFMLLKQWKERSKANKKKRYYRPLVISCRL